MAITGVVAACMFVGYAAAQDAFTPHPAEAVLRGAALGDGVLFVSAHDTNEVLKIDLSTGGVAARAAVQEGPTGVALSADGKTVACVNRVANSVSLIHADTMETYANVSGAQGATDVAALPGGGFAVANSFGDSVTLIDAGSPDKSITLSGVSSVPSGVAASESYLGVATRNPSALLLYAGGAQTPSAIISVPEGASSVHALSGDRFVVGSKGHVSLIDAKAAKVIDDAPLSVYDVAVDGNAIYVMTDGAVAVFDDTLAPKEKRPVTGEGRTVAARNGAVVVLVPKNRQWLASGVAAPVKVAESPAEPAEKAIVAAAPPPVQPEPEENASPEPGGNKGNLTPAPVTANEAKPAEAPAKAEEQPAQEPIKVAEAPAGNEPAAPEKSEEEAASAGSTETKPAAPKERKNRLSPQPAPAQPEDQKKSFSRKPSPSQLDQGTQGKTFGEAVTEGINLGTSAGGFEPPDWTEPFRDLQADKIQTMDGGTKIVADGDVRLTLDTVQFAADHLYYDKLTGELHVSGNVEVVQGQSTAFADDIQYTMPADKKLEVPPPLAPAGEDVEQGLARKMLSLGSLDAKNIEINEPTRQLKADHIVYDFTTQTGQAEGVEGHAGQVRFGGESFAILGEDAMQGKNLWLTTCDCDHEYYKVRLKEANFGKNDEITGKGANLQIGSIRTPVYWPRWSFSGGDAPTVGFDFDSGRKAKLGYYVNVGQQFAVTTNLKLGLRLLPTTKQGIGVGIDGSYDFMETPASPLFRSKGEFHTLYTTKDRGYTEWYHRQELTPDTVLLVQLEQWYDRDFYKDFFYERYKDRSDPRTFANVAYTQPGYVATATVRPRTNGFTTETERLPEATFHLLEREVADRLYVSFDTIGGYNNREPYDEEAIRSINVARLSYDLQLVDHLNVTPFLELEGSWYSKTRNDEGAEARFSSTAGVTLQTRLQKNYPGRWGFSEFKHLVVPSLTYSYRPESTMGIEDTPKFDAYDRVFGRSRIEGKVDNIILGRDAETEESWQVARLSLYHGTDFWNEVSRGNDYELELEVRPRPWWGFMAIGESHSVNEDIDFRLDEPFVVQRTIIQLYERLTGRRADPEAVDRYNASYGDYERVLAYFYYDDRPFSGRFNGRVGFAYTQTQDEVFNREVLYGAGYKLNEKWSLGFEHVFDLEEGDLSRQKYEVRRVMQCVEGALQFNERESGWDVGVEFSVTAFPGTRLKF